MHIFYGNSKYFFGNFRNLGRNRLMKLVMTLMQQPQGSNHFQYFTKFVLRIFNYNHEIHKSILTLLGELTESLGKFRR